MMVMSNRAVVERRSEPPDSLDFFPTPPWATRALVEYLAGVDCFFTSRRLSEPAAGEGHMVEVLRETNVVVEASDVHDYGRGYRVGSYVGAGPDVLLPLASNPHWVITNPPFNLAEAFLARALDEAMIGVALLMRSNWIDGQGRFERVFARRPPRMMLQFSERVAMVKGRFDPDATTATAYAWFVWLQSSPQPTLLDWVPPGTKARLTRPDDRERFAAWSLEAPHA